MKIVTETYFCQIDNTQHASRQSLHEHLKKLRIKQETFYRQAFPDRKDLLTGEPIEFKSVDFYLYSFFNTRKNMLNYFIKNPNPDEIWALFESRKKQKNWQFFPSTVETRTSILPSELFLQKIGQSSNTFATLTNLKLRYDYAKDLIFDDFEPLSILIDSREQNPLKLACETTVAKLDVGDYISKSHFNSISVDRKSLVDLCGTISQGYDRFIREIERAKELGLYLVVLVEEKLEKLLNLPFLPETQRIKASPDFISSRIRDLCQTYENLQFVFVDGRSAAAKLLTKIFTFIGDSRNIDWQFQVDSNHLCI